MTKYSDQKNIQILISLLKQYGINRIIVDPGTTVTNFVGSIQDDDFFKLYSSVDERSAAYMACGMSAESGEPVALVCTGATASRNYLPGLTEAFYRKLPVLAITSTIFRGNIGHNIPQVIDRSVQLKDVANISVQVPTVVTPDDQWFVTVEINKALQALTENGGGPAHINLEIGNAPHFSVKTLPAVRKIDKYRQGDDLPEINQKRVGIFVGAHDRWSDELTKAVDCFVAAHNAVVLCDSTSNYFGKYRIMANIILDQESYQFDDGGFDLIIHIGNVSGSYMKFKTNEVWRVSPDGKIVDTFRKLTAVFAMNELDFFKHYSARKSHKTTHYESWHKEHEKLVQVANKAQLPFSNIWVARELSQKLADNSTLHLGILSSLRSWNFFERKHVVYGYSNVGGFGIDGGMSSLIGASLVHPERNYYAVIGDLAFFYDLNSLGNRMVRNNLRILLINNGCGAEFHLHINPAFQCLGHDGVSKYIAANGHFGNRSKDTVKNFVESLGFEYLSAGSKTEFEAIEDYFTSPKQYDRPLVLEIFTSAEDENAALRTMRNLESTVKGRAKNHVKKTMAKMLSGDAKRRIRKIITKS